MGKPSPAQLELARRLLNRELWRTPDPEAAVARFCEQLLLHLSPLVGTAGVHALLERSVKLTRAEHSCLAQFIPTSAQTPSTEEGRMSEQLREVLVQGTVEVNQRCCRGAVCAAALAARDAYSGTDLPHK